MRFASHSVNGVRKATNQDGLCVLAAETAFGPVVFAAVCDGVGGLAAGELASSVVVRRFEQWFETGLPAYLSANCRDGLYDLSGISHVWGNMLAEVNSSIFAYGEENGTPLGTTFTGVLRVPGSYYVGQVGDSRAYRYAQGQLTRLTRDQSWVADEVEAGNLTEEEAFHHPQSNVIYQAVGAQRKLAPAFTSGVSESDDLFLVCCDGLYRDVPASRLEQACAQASRLSTAEMQRLCEQLVQESIDNGSTDNVSLLLFAAEGPDAIPGLSAQASDQSAAAGQNVADDTPTVFSMDARTVLNPNSGPANNAEGGEAR